MIANTSGSVVNALSFDIEDWFHLVDVAAVKDPQMWTSLPSIVERYTEHILDVLAGSGTLATFFVLGWIAERYPSLVRRIAEQGHEIASHSFWHRKVYSLAPEEFATDVSRSKTVLEDITGRSILGFRAPSFSIIPGTEWAFDVLLDLGLSYDASLFPAARAHGGYPCTANPHLRATPRGRHIRELPMSVIRLAGRPLAFSGGGYLRLLPLSVLRLGVERLNQRGLPAVVYLHPRDFAHDAPRVPMPLHRRFKSYVGVHTTDRKLRALLANYRFTTCGDVIEKMPLER